MLAVHARKPHKTLRAQWARMTVEPVMTGMTTHATRADRAGRATDGDLLFDMLVKLVYAGDITIEMVYFVCKIVEFFNDPFIVILRRLGQSHKTRIRFHGPCHKNCCDDQSSDGRGCKEKTRFVGPTAALVNRRE